MVLSGKKVNLRSLRLSDYKWLFNLINDKRVNRYLLTNGVKTLVEEKKHIAKMIKDKKANHFILEIKGTNEHIGIMSLAGIDMKHKRGRTGAFMMKQFWNKGYGADAKMTLLKYAFIKLNLNRIESFVHLDNPRSLAYSKKCGYKVEGIARQRVLKGKKFLDEYVLAVLKKDWIKLAKKYDYI